MTSSEFLKAIKDLIKDPEHWTQVAIARDINGQPTFTLAKNAVSWCLKAAMYKVGNYNQIVGKEPFNRARLTLNRIVGCDCGLFNDSHTHTEVIALLDKAIEMTEAEETA
jgi:hypothetical protein